MAIGESCPRAAPGEFVTITLSTRRGRSKLLTVAWEEARRVYSPTPPLTSLYMIRRKLNIGLFISGIRYLMMKLFI
jgi:hypothetical protein